MKSLIKILSLLILTGFLFSCTSDDENLCNQDIELTKLNQYQIIGSHNSYRLKTNQLIFNLVSLLADSLPEENNPASWDYNNQSPDIQLDIYKLRSFELDVFRDPVGGLFYNRQGNDFVGLDIESGIDELKDPGLKVLHFPDLDYNTHFYTFKEALNYFKNWSAMHPLHLPISILVEAKEDSPNDLIPGYGLTAAIPFTDHSVEEIENEINDVFGSNTDQILYPDDVKQSYPTLREAVLNHAWPALEFLRGKIIFILMADDHIITDYIDGYPSLTGRTMFAFTDATKDEAAFLNINDPTSNYQMIKDFVQQGFMVRTQADSNTYEARSGDYTRMFDAFNSGAQIICTDYYRADPRASIDQRWTDYHVSFPENWIAIFNQLSDLTSLVHCEITE